MLDQMDGPLGLISNVTGEFNEAAADFKDVVNNVKQGWTELKNGYETCFIIPYKNIINLYLTIISVTLFRYEAARADVDLVFGEKMNKKFPRKYMESRSCGNGFWKGRRKLNTYKTEGIEVGAEVNSKVIR